MTIRYVNLTMDILDAGKKLRKGLIKLGQQVADCDYRVPYRQLIYMASVCMPDRNGML